MNIKDLIIPESRQGRMRIINGELEVFILNEMCDVEEWTLFDNLFHADRVRASCDGLVGWQKVLKEEELWFLNNPYNDVLYHKHGDNKYRAICQMEFWRELEKSIE